MVCLAESKNMSFLWKSRSYKDAPMERLTPKASITIGSMFFIGSAILLGLSQNWESVSDYPLVIPACSTGLGGMAYFLSVVFRSQVRDWEENRESEEMNHSDEKKMGSASLRESGNSGSKCYFSLR